MHRDSPRPRGRLRAALLAVCLTLAAAIAAPSAAVAADPFTGVGAPSISGSGAVGTDFTVSLNSPALSPTPQSILYDWHRVDNGALLVSSASDRYTATAALVGTPVYVKVTLGLSGNPAAYVTYSSFSATVHLGSFSGVNNPVISGTGAIGDTLTASLDTTGTLPAPDAVTYTWHRVDTGDVVGTGAELTVARAWEGTALYVIARLSAAGHSDYVTSNSAFSATVHRGGFTGVGAPSVSGSGVIGTDFTATIDTAGVTPAPDAIAYEWFRVDTGASLGTGSTLTATRSLLGTSVYVVATLSGADRQDYVTGNSLFSATVRLRSFDGVGAPTVSGTGTVGTSFTAVLDTTGITPAPETIVYDWYRVDTGAHLGTGAQLAATAAIRGTAVYAVATLTATDTQAYVTANSAFSRGIHLASFTPGSVPELRGHHALGGTLTAHHDAAGWSPVPTSVTWQWYLADGTAIAGADRSSLALTRSLVGESVYAVATLSAPDTQPYVIATAPSGRIAAPTLSVGGSAGSVAVGDDVTVTAWGLLFDTEYDLELHSTPVALGAFTSAGDGTLRATVRIPAGTPAGDHRIVVLLDGEEITSIAITVVGDQDELAATGSDATPVVTALIGGGLLLAGLILVVALTIKRRQERTGHPALR